MRAFIAIETSLDVEKELSNIQTLLPKDIKLVKSFHLTLKFLGEITEEIIEKIKSLLSEVQCTAFTASLNQIGFFPDEKNPRVIWIGLEPEQKFDELYKAIETVLEKEFPPDKKFKAHITLARIRNPKAISLPAEAIKKIDVKKIEFKVEKFSLKKSKLTREGPIYENLAEFNLQ